MRLRLITIDYWNTIFDSTGGEERNFQRKQEINKVIQKSNIKTEGIDFDSTVKLGWKYFNNIWINENRTPSTIEMIEFIFDYLKIEKDKNIIARLVKVFSESILEYPPKLLPGVFDVLNKLEAEYMLAIVSDTGFSPGSILRVLLNDNRILHLFKAFSFSDESGVAKPHPNAFKKVLDELKVRPEEAIHIGDIERTDIAGAKALSMRAIKYNGDPFFKKTPDSNATAADYETNDWNEIYHFIKSLNSD